MPVDKSRLKGPLIQRCAECSYCIFEDILPESYRRSEIVDSRVPEDENHMHRELIEQLCGEDRDDICDMKYAAMRAALEEYKAAQFGAIKDLLQERGKKKNAPVDYEEGARKWTKSQDLGRGTIESYAERFREVWNLGVRKNTKGKKKQILKPDYLYEIVVAGPESYELALLSLRSLRREHQKRGDMGKKRA